MSTLTGRIGLSLGCGGTLGMSWTVATLRALEERWDWDARTADVIIGTSAGAELAALLGSGTSVTELLAAQQESPDAPPWVVAHLAADPGRVPPLRLRGPGSLGLVRRGLHRQAPGLAAFTGLLPRGCGDPTWLRTMADRCAGPNGWVSHPATWLVAADYDTGERVVLGRDMTASLADAVCASWGLPGWMPAVKIGGRRLVDGGILSPASADLLIDANVQTAVVLAPMASSNPGRPIGALARVERLARRSMTRTLDTEIATLEAAGVEVHRFEPNGRDLAAMGGNFMDARRRASCLVAARLSAMELANVDT